MKTRRDVIRPIRQLVRQQCASLHNGTKCHYCPDDQPICCFFREDGEYPNLLSKGAVRCRYLEENILPADPALELAYWGKPEGDHGQEVTSCESCKQSFVKKSNRQKFCPACRKVETAKATRKRMREKYWSDKGQNLTV